MAPLTGESGRERDVADVTVVNGLLAKDFVDNAGDGVPERYPKEIGLEVPVRDMAPPLAWVWTPRKGKCGINEEL
jgi:hypothetical protein